MMRFIDELEKGNPVYIYLLDGEYVEAVELLGSIIASHSEGWLDVVDADGDWTSINTNQITCVVPAKDKKKK